MSARKLFLDKHGSVTTYFMAEHMHDIISQIKPMINSTVPYSVYACVADPTQLTILSCVISLLNEKNLSQELAMTVKPEQNGYFIEVHLLQGGTW